MPAGDQYDVREGGTSSGGDVRNLGKPVQLAERYFKEGADEVSFLNITGFRDFPLQDLPMLQVWRTSCCSQRPNMSELHKHNMPMPRTAQQQGAPGAPTHLAR